MLLFFANVLGAGLQVRGEAQALRAEMETQRTRATQLEQLFQQQVNGRPLALAFTILDLLPPGTSSPSGPLIILLSSWQTMPLLPHWHCTCAFLSFIIMQYQWLLGTGQAQSAMLKQDDLLVSLNHRCLV